MIHKVGIIGFGGMGEWHHRSIPQSGTLEVVAAYDIRPEKVERAIECGYKGYYSLDEFLADKDIEIVLIVTPNNSHKELSIASLNAGKNVICEKPAMMNSADLIEVVDHAKKKGLLFAVHQNRRWDDDFLIAKKVLDEGLIGIPFYIESRVQGSYGTFGWRIDKASGGGMLYDWGVHLLDQIMWMIDSPVVEIYAHLLKVKTPDVDDNFKLMLKFENGLSVLVQVDTYCFAPLPRWHVSGDAGTLIIEGGWTSKGTLYKAKTDKVEWSETIVYTSGGPTRTMAPRPVETIDKCCLPEVQTDWIDYYRKYAAALEGKEEFIVKNEECIRVLKVIDAAFESSEKGICVKTRI